jgi:hypothetical protein
VGPELIRWDLRLGEVAARRSLGAPARQVAASLDGRVVAAVLPDPEDPRGARCHLVLRVGERPGASPALPHASWNLAAVSGDGSRVAVGEPGGRVVVFEPETGREVARFEVRPLEGGRVRRVVAVDLSWAGRYLLTRTQKGGGRRVQLETWEVDTDRWLEGAWIAPDFGSPSFLPRGGLGGSPHQVDSGWRLARMDREPGRETGSVLWMTQAPVTAYSRTLDAGVVLEETRLLVMRRGTGEEVGEAEHHLVPPPLPLLGHACDQVVCEAEGARVWACGDRPLTRLDRATGEVVRPPVTSWWRGKQMAWAGAPTLLRTLDVSGSVRDLSVTPDGHLRSIPLKKAVPLAACLSPSSRLLACIDRPPRLEPLGAPGEGAIHDLSAPRPARLLVHFVSSTREPLPLESDDASLPRPLGFDHQDRWLATEVRLEDGHQALDLAATEDGAWVGPTRLAGPVACHAFSPEGAWVAAACQDSAQLTVRPLSPPGEALHVDVGSADIRALRFLPGERLLVAGDGAGALRVVDLRALALARVARLPGDAVTSLALDREARTLLVTCHDGCLYEVDVDTLSEPVLAGRVR